MDEPLISDAADPTDSRDIESRFDAAFESHSESMLALAQGILS